MSHWKDDVWVRMMLETRAKLKLQAHLKGLTLRDYLEELAQKNGKSLQKNDEVADIQVKIQ